MVISLPIDVLPDSELALQLPLDECGSSLLPNAVLRCLRMEEDSRSLTGLIEAGMLVVAPVPEATVILLSDEE